MWFMLNDYLLHQCVRVIFSFQLAPLKKIVLPFNHLVVHLVPYVQRTEMFIEYFLLIILKVIYSNSFPLEEENGFVSDKWRLTALKDEIALVESNRGEIFLKILSYLRLFS